MSNATLPHVQIPPDDFASWPTWKRNKWFAEGARAYREFKAREPVTSDKLSFVANQVGELATCLEGEPPLPLFPALPPACPYPIEALSVLQPAALAIARKVQVPAATAAQRGQEPGDDGGRSALRRRGGGAHPLR